MSREIKFEYGFESINGIIKKQYYLHEIHNIANICDIWGILPIVYVRQFTGHTDKNGKEVYEGDIVIWSAGEKAVIEWVDGDAEFSANPDLDPSFGSFVERPLLNGIGSMRYYEVIGNIYDSPELLENQ